MISQPLTTADLRARVEALCPELASLPASPLERWQLPMAPASPVAPASVPESFHVWVKRDDLLGEGGTKLRKFLAELPDVRARGGRVLTFGYLDSNHALATARWGAKHGVPVDLWLLGKEPENPARVALLQSIAKRKFHRTPFGLQFGSSWRRLLALLRGQRTMIFPPGGTTARSTAAVASAVAEVVEQFAGLGEKVPEHWAVAVGSGGTLAGLRAGASALGLKVRIHGVAASTRWVGPWRVSRLANRALRLLGVAARVRSADVDVSLQLLGAGHGRPPITAQETLRELAALGHELDPIFTARALAWLRSHARPGERWLFWHTGVAVQ